MSTSALKTISFFSVLGLIVSLLSTYHYFSNTSNNSCLGNEPSCDIVNKSVYSKIFGVPIAVIGVGGYFFLFVLSTLKFNLDKKTVLIFFTSVIGFLFTFYLLYIQLFILHTVCLLCVTSVVIISIIFVISVYSFGKNTINQVKKILIIE